MAPRRLLLSLLCTVIVISACDRLPSDPLDARGDLAALLDGESAGAYTLPGLLHAAVHRVYTEHGASTARALVGDLRRLQQDSRRAMVGGDRETATAGMAAVQAAELDIVLRVFGAGVVERTIAAVALDAARLQRGIAEGEAAGRDMTRSQELVQPIDDLLAQARQALAAGRTLAALDAATRAAANAEAVRNIMVDAGRVAGLAELFDLAASHLRTEYGVDGEKVLEGHAALRRAAAAAARSGDREHAQRAAEAVRDEEIRIVLAVLGPESVQRLVEAVSRGIADATATIGETNRDVSRLQRMVATARDMNVRARASLAAADAATALDLASHAAGLVNSARLALTAQ